MAPARTHVGGGPGPPRPAGRPRRRAAALAVSFVALLAAAAPAHAALLVDHVSTSVTETAGNGDGLVGPGDTFTIAETIRNSEPSLTGITSTLTTATSGLAIDPAASTSAYPNLGFGQSAANTTPFRATLGGAVDCGVNLAFNLALSTDQGSETIPFTVGTGAAGPPQAYTSVDVPRAIGDMSSADSAFTVATAGRVKNVTVRIARITHDYVGDLRIELIAPDGTTVVLVDQRGGAGDNFVDTVFSQSAATSIAAGSAPFTGTFRPEGDLSTLNGHQQQGTWRLRVRDLTPANTGTIDGWGADLSPAVCDGSPIASFTSTPNPVLPGGTVTFDGSASTDPNGTIAKYEWDLNGDATDGAGGDGFELDTGTTATTTRVFPTQGSFPVRLRVTDNTGARNVRSATVAVTQAPSASFTATPPSPLTGQQVSFDASASSDSDGTLARYEWDLDGDGSYETDTGTTATTTRTYASAGTVPVHLRVTDNDGAVGTRTVDVVVQNRAPIASFTRPTPAIVGEAATFSASGSSDPDGTITQYAWDFDGDGTYDTTTGTPSIDHTFGASGAVNVVLRVTDNDGSTATQTLSVTVTRRPTASFTATANPTPLGVPVVYSAVASSDPDGSIVRYEWDLDGNGSYETDTGSTATASRSYAAAGVFAIRLRVTDDAGATATTSVAVTAANALPAASFAISANPIPAGQPVEFDASLSSDPDGTLVKYEWDLDANGTFETVGGSSPRALRAYANRGSFDVRVRVTDDDGGTATATRTLTVTDPPPAGTTTVLPPDAPGAGGGGAGGPVLDPRGFPIVGTSLTGPALQPLGLVLRRGLTLFCRTDRAVRCTLTAEIQARDARRLGLGRRRLAVGRIAADVAGGQERTLRLVLRARARRALRRARAVRVLVRGTASAPGAATVKLARVVLVRR